MKLWKLEIHKGKTGFDKIEQQWDELFNSIKNPVYTQSPIWHKAYLQHLCANIDKCYYFCVFRNNKLIAVFPFEQTLHRFYFLKLASLGFSRHDHFGLNSVVVDESEDVAQVFEFLYQSLKKEKNIKWSIIYLERSIQGSQSSSCKISNARLTFQSPGSPCNTLSIQDYEDTVKNLSKNFKNNLRKARKHLSKINNVTVGTATDKDTLIDFYEHFLKVEASGWKGASGTGTAIALDSGLSGFYRDVMLGFSHKKQMEISLLIADEKTIAAQYVIILGSTVYVLKIGYDEKKSKLSPSNMLKEYKLKEYANIPELKTMNLISDASWHNNWKPITLKSKNLYHCRNYLVAFYIQSLLFLRHILRAVKTRFNN